MLFFIAVPAMVGSRVLAQDSNLGITNPDKLYTVFPKTFISDIFWRDKISPDGKYIAGRSEGDVYILDLANPEAQYLRKNTSLEWVNEFDWMTGQEVTLRGMAGSEDKTVTYNLSTKKETASGRLPGTGTGQISGIYIYKYFDEQSNVGGVYISRPGKENAELILPGLFPASMSLSSDQKTLAYLYLKSQYSLCLGLYNIDTKENRDLAVDLDGTLKSEITFDPENKHVMLSLVTDKLDNYQKHQAVADRDLDLYAIHIATGAIIPVLIEEGDDVLVGVAGGKIIWNKIFPNVRTCILPADGSKVIPMIPELSFMPTWNNQGDQIAVVFGNWRMADVPLNWNIGTFTINKDGSVSEGLKPIAEGEYEEYGPAWSHDGSKLLYSARQNTPAFPTAGGMLTEDLFVVKTPEKEVQKLTEQFQEISDIDLSPDDTKAVISAVKTGETKYKAFLVTLGPVEAGKAPVQEISPAGISQNILSVSWSPDGSLIACETGGGSKSKSLWTFTPEGKNEKKLVDFESLTFKSGVDFTPDGKFIVYAAFDGSHHQLFKIPAGGGSPLKLTSNTYDLLYPEISPSGEWIATTLFRHTRQIWIADLIYE